MGRASAPPIHRIIKKQWIPLFSRGWGGGVCFPGVAPHPESLKSFGFVWVFEGVERAGASSTPKNHQNFESLKTGTSSLVFEERGGVSGTRQNREELIGFLVFRFPATKIIKAVGFHSSKGPGSPHHPKSLQT